MTFIFVVVYSAIKITTSNSGKHLVRVRCRGVDVGNSPYLIEARRAVEYKQRVGRVVLGGEGEMDGQVCRPWGITTDHMVCLNFQGWNNNMTCIYYTWQLKFLKKISSSHISKSNIYLNKIKTTYVSLVVKIFLLKFCFHCAFSNQNIQSNSIWVWLRSSIIFYFLLIESNIVLW